MFWGVLTPTFNIYQEKYMPPTWIGCWGGGVKHGLGFGSYVLLGEGGRGGGKAGRLEL